MSIYQFFLLLSASECLAYDHSLLLLERNLKIQLGISAVSILGAAINVSGNSACILCSKSVKIFAFHFSVLFLVLLKV